MATPSRHTARVDLSADGCPEWGSNFCLISTRGSTVYWERVNTVREIEVLSTELLDKDPYLVAWWQTLWADNHITDRDQLRSIRKSSLLGLNAAYIARARRAVTRFHQWGDLCKTELTGGLYPVTFEVLFQFLEDVLNASFEAHSARVARSGTSVRPFKGTAPLGLIRDLKVSARLLKIEISEAVLQDKLFQSRFCVAKTADAAPEHAVLGFSSWCGLELMAASLAGMDLDTGSVDLDARMPPSAEGTSQWVPDDPVPAPMLDGWEPDGQHSADAAQTFVVALLASLRTKEMLRSEIKDRRLRADGSVVVTGFCAGGKSTTAADRQPFFWYVDSYMEVTGTTNLWLWDWAGTRLNTGWMFPQYTLAPRSS